MSDATTLHCSFCGKSQHEVSKLIAGPTVFICDECVDLCKDIVDEERKPTIPLSAEPVPRLAQIAKSLERTEDIEKAARNALSVFLHRHSVRMSAASLADAQEALPPAHGLLVGPSLMRSAVARFLHEHLPVPFAFADAPTLMEIHEEVDVRQAIAHKLLNLADCNAQRAAQGIVYIDDLDQIGQLAVTEPSGPEASCKRVQRALANLMTGPKVEVTFERNGAAYGSLSLDMSGVTFLCAGAFYPLTRLVTAGDERAETCKRSGRLSKGSADVLAACGLVPELTASLSILITLEVAEPAG
ncbi:MAG: ClpX C4-type zinc finger protein [Pseudomonadota bacterium]